MPDWFKKTMSRVATFFKGPELVLPPLRIDSLELKPISNTAALIFAIETLKH